MHTDANRCTQMLIAAMSDLRDGNDADCAVGVHFTIKASGDSLGAELRFCEAHELPGPSTDAGNGAELLLVRRTKGAGEFSDNAILKRHFLATF